ncbi:hypothetical protein CH063_09924 [Colletotrichum higginsianum]|uniref:Uncharacterized protein n=1 Tax=Colletotrichum higginsianum (strain IMI 349063) TaxID=759273 RepID=H1VFG3_COLHI|nr:hypothetical protein CH063_09924 [Colletotrichum higginsianum]
MWCGRKALAGLAQAITARLDQTRIAPFALLQGLWRHACKPSYPFRSLVVQNPVLRDGVFRLRVCLRRSYP